MDIQKAFEITNTKNANQLAALIGRSHTAVYKWLKSGSVPETSEARVLKAAGVYPDVNRLKHKRRKGHVNS